MAIRCNFAATTYEQSFFFTCELLEMVSEPVPSIEHGFATAMEEGWVVGIDMAYQLSRLPSVLFSRLACNTTAKTGPILMSVIQVIDKCSGPLNCIWQSSHAFKSSRVEGEPCLVACEGISDWA